MTLAESITAIGNVTTMVTDTSINLLEVFMQPPLIFFVGLALAGSIFYLTKGLLRRR